MNNIAKERLVAITRLDFLEELDRVPIGGLAESLKPAVYGNADSFVARMAEKGQFFKREDMLLGLLGKWKDGEITLVISLKNGIVNWCSFFGTDDVRREMPIASWLYGPFKS